MGLGFILACLAASGCVTVKPWEKQTLSERYMDFDQSTPSQPFITHAQVTVEQAEGGDGGAGGGCGCR